MVQTIWTVQRGTEARQITFGLNDSSPKWSPSGTHLAFLRFTDGFPHVWIMPAAGGEPRPLTRSSDFPLGVEAIVWSPDGTRIALLAPIDIAPTSNVNSPIVVHSNDYQSDGHGLWATVRKHVFVVDLTTGNLERLTFGDAFAGVPSWSPDGTRLAFTWRSAVENDIKPHIPLATVDLDRHRVAVLGSGDCAMEDVRWSPVPDYLIAVGRLGPMSVGHSHLYRIDARDGSIVDLVPSLDRNVMVGHTAYPGNPPVALGDTVYFGLRDHGCTHLYSVPLAGGDARPVASGADRAVWSLTTSGKSAAALIATRTIFGEVALVDLNTFGDPEKNGELLTHHQEKDLVPYIRERRSFTISDGTTVEGWTIRDPSVHGASPLLLDVHGGPHNAWNGTADPYHLYQQELVAQGWTVLIVNPRGSDGYGEDFYMSVVGEWGVSDAKDFLEPIDALITEGVVDPDRLAITGYSYGGFTTCYLTSREPTRFRAAVAGGVVSDLSSAFGTSDIGSVFNRTESGGYPWESPAHLSALNPIAQVERVVTPTLILHGLQDRRCAVGQGQQWFAALRHLGVPTELVLYPGGSHSFVLLGPPSQRIDYHRRLLSWLERFVIDDLPQHND